MVVFPWFMYNGVDSRDMGLWVKELPAPARAEERAETVEIPGRAGHLTLKEGVDVHNSRLMECVVQAPYTADFEAILAWLTGSGKVIFSGNENRVYDAEITAEVKFDKVSNSIKEAVIPFFVQPHAGQYPPESAITITGESGTITNPGNVAARPIVEVTYEGNIQINIGDSAMAFTAVPGKLTVDCGANIVLDENGELWQGVYSGDFWRIEPGENEITADNSCTLKITPNWRWK